MWNIYVKKEQTRQYFYRASLEKSHVSSQQLQNLDFQNIFAEINSALSSELRPNFESVSLLNNALELKNSFVGKSEELTRENFIKRVKPVLQREEIQKLYK